MREQIISILQKSDYLPVSGEKIATQLGISRAAVWKHITVLRSQGYNITIEGKRGYILAGIPDALHIGIIKQHLRTFWLGGTIYKEETVTSTNNIAKEKAQEGAPHGSVVLAETQTAGRGRINRGWYSPYGKGIWCSLILRPNWLPKDAAKCTLMVAVALRRTFARLYDVVIDIKWPNDILYKGKKLVGILTEMNAQMDGINYIVIGVGINVNIDKNKVPDELKDILISVEDIIGKPVLRVNLLVEFLRDFEVIYDNIKKVGFDEMLEEWRFGAVTLGKEVDVIGIGESYSGVAIDIDKDGALLVQTADGTVNTVLAGDVKIRAR